MKFIFIVLALLFVMNPYLSNAQSKGRVKANGIELYYEIHGEGSALVLIEGLGVATWFWEEQVPEFSKHFKTVIFDNRGVGQSDKPEGFYTISMMADDLKGLLDSLKIKKTHILGISMGGFIAQDFAARFPEMVDRLVLVSTSAGGKEHTPMTHETLALVLTKEGEPRELTRKKLALAYTEAFMQNTEKLEHLIDLRMQNPQPPYAFTAQATAGAMFDYSEQAKSISVPTLIMAATEDLLVPVVNAENLRAKIPGSKLKTYEGYGHQFNIEIAEDFNKTVIEFLTEKMTQK